MDVEFCVEALKEAVAKYGKPEIMNSDQGSQFTGFDWIQALIDADIKISMDGRGRWIDNRMIERLWRSLKQEAVYLHELTYGFVAERVIGEWIGFYNTERPNSTHGITLHDSWSFWDFQPWFDGGTRAASQEPSDLVEASAEPGFCVVTMRFSPQLSLAYEN